MRLNRKQRRSMHTSIESFNILIENQFFWIELSKYFTLDDWKHLALVSKKVNKYWTNVRDSHLLGNQKAFNKALQYNKLNIIKMIFNNPLFLKNINLNIVSLDKVFYIVFKDSTNFHNYTGNKYFSTLYQYCCKYSCVIYAAMNGHIELFNFLFNKLCNKNNDDYYIFGILLYTLFKKNAVKLIDILLNTKFLHKYIDWSLSWLYSLYHDERLKIIYTGQYTSPFIKKKTSVWKERFEVGYTVPIIKLYEQMQDTNFFDYNFFNKPSFDNSSAFLFSVLYTCIYLTRLNCFSNSFASLYNGIKLSDFTLYLPSICLITNCESPLIIISLILRFIASRIPKINPLYSALLFVSLLPTNISIIRP